MRGAVGQILRRGSTTKRTKKVIDLISDEFSIIQVKQYLLVEAEAAWNSKKVKGSKEEKEDFIVAYKEKNKIPLLKTRIKN